MENSSTGTRIPFLLTLTMILAISLSLLVLSCRKKESTIVGPPPDSTGSWTITLEDTSTLYVPNDTINVHLYTPAGILSIGRLLRFRAEIDSNRITQSATTANSTWGCTPPLLYWGTGGGDQENRFETVHAYYIDPQSHDTLAAATKTYRIVNRP